MTNLTKLLLIIAALIIAFAFGRYTTPSSSEITKTDDKQVTTTVTHDTTTTTKSPDGTVTVTKTKDSTEKKIEDTKTTDNKKIATSTANAISLQALAGVDTRNSLNIVYGLAVSKQVLGPINAGLFGMNNGIVGVTVGVSF